MITSDALFRGKLILLQYEKGYRFSVDALLLAGLTGAKSDDAIVDLGTGCGVVPLIMAHRRLGRELVGIEIQSELVELATGNVRANGFSSLISIVQTDFRKVSEIFSPESFDLVVSNPPYRRLESGRINLHEQKALARHEIAGSILDVFKAGRYLLHRGGRLAVIYPSTRLGHLLVAAQENGFSPKGLTVIHSKPGSCACLVHLECRKGGGEELRIHPPFVIYRENGVYSNEMLRLLEDGSS